MIDGRRADRQQFADDLARLRIEAGVSYASLSTTLGCPRSTLNGWIKGRNLPYPRHEHTFVAMLAEFGIAGPAPWLRRLRALRDDGEDAAPLDNPYPGLRPYTESDATRFFGRTSIVDRLCRLVEDRECTHIPVILVGPSGAGKSSVLRAGLLGAATVAPGARYETPTDDPFEWAETLAGAVAIRASSQLVQADARPMPVVVDQFERVFMIHDVEERRRTLECIAAIAAIPEVVLVVGLRADFFQHAMLVPWLRAAATDRQVVLGPMSVAELSDAILEPARSASLEVAPELLVRLVNECAETSSTADDGGVGSLGQLPLLAHTLFRLAEARVGSRLTMDVYTSIGGIAGALETSAERLFASLDAAQRLAAEEFLGRLVDIDRDGVMTLRMVRSAEVDRLKAQTAALSEVIDRFVDARLATVDERAVVLAHEALLTAWPRLEDLVEHRREALLVLRQVRRRRRLWAESGRGRDDLLKGTLLDAASALTDNETADRLDVADLEYLGMSLSERRVDDRLRDEAVATLMSMQSTMALATDSSMAGPLALGAYEVAPCFASRSAVISAVHAIGGPRFVDTPAAAMVAAASAVARVVAANPVSGLVSVFQSEGAVSLSEQRLVGVAPRMAQATALSADGRFLAIASAARLCVVEIGRRWVETVLSTRIAVRAEAHVVTFVGTTLFASGFDGAVRCWELSDDDVWTECSPLERPGRSTAVATDSDASVVATIHDGTTLFLWRNSGDATWDVVWRLDGRAGVRLSAVAVAPDASSMAVGAHDGSVRFWRLVGRLEPEEVESGEPPFATWVNSIAYSPGGEQVAVASSDGIVGVWATTDRTSVAVLPHPTVVTSVAWVDDRRLVTGAEDGIVRSWTPRRMSSGFSASIWTVRPVNDAGTVLVASTEGIAVGSVLDTGLQAGGWRRTAAEIGSALSGSCDIEPRGRWIAVGTRTGEVIVLDALEPERQRSIDDALGDLVEFVSFDRCANRLVAVDRSGRCQLWNVDAEGGCTPHGGGSVADAALLSAAFVNGLGRRESVVALTCEDGSFIVADVGGDVATPMATVPASRGFPISVAAHPTRPILAVGGSDREVTLWDVSDVRTPTRLAAVDGPSGNVMSLAFDHQGSRLAAGITDGSAWIWDTRAIAEPEAWAHLRTGASGVYCVAFDIGGDRLLTSGPHGSVNWWPLTSVDDWLRRRVGDPLTAEEFGRYAPGTHMKLPGATRNGLPSQPLS